MVHHHPAIRRLVARTRPPALEAVAVVELEGVLVAVVLEEEEEEEVARSRVYSIRARVRLTQVDEVAGVRLCRELLETL